MGTMIFISTVAIIVGIVGSFVIWRFDASRAEEIKHNPAPVGVPVLPQVAGTPPHAVEPRHLKI